MSEDAKPNDFKIGLFVVLAIGLLLAGVSVFGATRFFERKSIEETYVTGSVSGLKEGAPVLLRGVPVGEVTRIDFSWNVYRRAAPRYVVVQFDLRGKVSLVPPGQAFARLMEEEVNRGLRARIKSQGLVGATVVSLEYLDPKEYPPVEVPWKPQHIYIPAAPGQFSEMLDSIETTISHVQKLDIEGVVKSVQRDLAAVERLVHDVDEVNFASVGTNANATLKELRDVSTQLRSVIANLDIASLNDTVENAQRATRELDEVLRQFKTYPAGALFGKPPPPAHSVEPPRR